MDVMNPQQARVAEEAGAVAVMALERIPAGKTTRCGSPLALSFPL